MIDRAGFSTQQGSVRSDPRSRGQRSPSVLDPTKLSARCPGLDTRVLLLTVNAAVNLSGVVGVALYYFQIAHAQQGRGPDSVLRPTVLPQAASTWSIYCGREAPKGRTEAVTRLLLFPFSLPRPQGEAYWLPRTSCSVAPAAVLPLCATGLF